MKQLALGFTLVELIVTLALIAAIAAYGVPMFERLIANNRLTAQANDFVSALLFARTESIKRNQRVTLCISSDGATCATSGSWDQGWIAFTDANTLQRVDGTDTIIRVGAALPDAFTFVGAGNVTTYISYVPTGRSQLADGSGAAQNGTLTLRHRKLADTTSFFRRIVINRTGRAEVQQ